MTEAGSVIGTAQYLSPEQARGDEVTAASDCYAVGIVLYEMLTGRRARSTASRPVAVAMKQISDPPHAAARARAEHPARARGASCCAALAKRPSERYRTAEEFSRALAEARAAIDRSGSTTRVMAGRRRADGSRMDTGHRPPPGSRRRRPPDEPPRGPPALALDRRRASSLLRGAPSSPGSCSCGGDDAKAVTIPPVAGQSAADAQQRPRGPAG